MSSARARRKLMCGVISDAHVREVFGENANLKSWKEAGRVPKAAVMPKLKTSSKAGRIVCIEDRTMFRLRAELYPSMIESLREHRSAQAFC